VGSCPLFLFGAGRLTAAPTTTLVGAGFSRPETQMQPLEQVRAIAERVAASRGLEIWDIQSRREATGHVVRVFIDRPGPAATPEESVSIEDCEQVNREISTILDVEDPLPFAYTLEVSSPGLDRPLRSAGDYQRFAGRLAKVVVSEAVDNQKAFEGHLRGVEGNDVLLEAPNGRVHRLPLRAITRGRLEVEF
jgi:ribosome maturation factor RimP